MPETNPKPLPEKMGAWIGAAFLGWLVLIIIFVGTVKTVTWLF